MTGRRPGVLLDRDGTIIVDPGYLGDPDGVVFEDHAIEGLAMLADAGLPVAVVTNQSGIARGYYDLAAASAVNDRIDALLAPHGVAIAGWYVCPHAPDGDCGCRKPRPGLAEAAARDLDLDLARSWVVGDKRSDLELALGVGSRGILVTTGDGRAHVDWALDHGIAVCDSLLEAARSIVDAVAADRAVRGISA